MDRADMSNDLRGWIMCIVSGIACVMGASIICVDVPIRMLPGKADFRIQDSNTFLACSLSLSFGVMIFSALYSLLPSSRKYFIGGRWDDQSAGFLMMGCLVGGFFGIQIISRLLHQLIPSHVVDCDHTREEVITEGANGHGNSRRQSFLSPSSRRSREAEENPNASESSPLLNPDNGQAHNAQSSRPELHATTNRGEPNSAKAGLWVRSRSETRRLPMFQVPQRVMSFFKDTKANCEDSPCKGYSDLCDQEVFKHIGTRSAFSRPPTFARPATGPLAVQAHQTFSPGSAIVRELSCSTTGQQSLFFEYRASRERSNMYSDGPHSHRPHLAVSNIHGDDDDDDSETMGEAHHHHVPINPFMSIGLQTVIAITLHKFPEGFITYATNHANPDLGFNVFMALAVHNIAEGFTLTLPLYMALSSRRKAIFAASVLGGASQPIGAGFAVLWFQLANRSNMLLNKTAYACLFATTAGIMTSVALQLFVESLSLNHNRNLSILFAFIGMALLGFSNALVTH